MEYNKESFLPIQRHLITMSPADHVSAIEDTRLP